MTDLKNIYDYLEKINFEERIKEEVKFIRDIKNNPDFGLMVCPFVMTQFVFSIIQDFYEEIYKDIEEIYKDIEENQKLKQLLEECSPYVSRSATSRLTKNSIGHRKDMKLLTKIDEAIKKMEIAC